jgi:hypothetical protein
VDGPTYANSWWAVHFLTTTTDLDVMLISRFDLATNGTNPNGENAYATSYYELKSGYYTDYVVVGETVDWNNDTLDAQFGNSYGWLASEDNFSSMTSWTTIGNVTFNITFVPDGPILFYGGTGNFFLGYGSKQ